MHSKNKQAALSYAQKGWKVFPVTPNQKRPLTALAPEGHKSATSDLATIEQWWTEHANANIGLYLEPSGLVCVDVDSNPMRVLICLTAPSFLIDDTTLVPGAAFWGDCE